MGYICGCSSNSLQRETQHYLFQLQIFFLGLFYTFSEIFYVYSITERQKRVRKQIGKGSRQKQSALDLPLGPGSGIGRFSCGQTEKERDSGACAQQQENLVESQSRVHQSSPHADRVFGSACLVRHCCGTRQDINVQSTLPR